MPLPVQPLTAKSLRHDRLLSYRGHPGTGAILLSEQQARGGQREPRESKKPGLKKAAPLRPASGAIGKRMSRTSRHALSPKLNVSRSRPKPHPSHPA